MHHPKPFSRRAAIAMLPAACCGLAACAAPGPAAQPLEAARMLRRAVAPDVVELAFSPRQRALFVAAPDWEDEHASVVLRLDPATLEVRARIPLRGKGFGVALDDAAARLYVTQGFNGGVAVIDIARNQVLAQVPLLRKVNFAQTYREHGLSAPRTAFLLKALKGFKVVEDYPYKLREMALDRRRHRLFLPGLGLGLDSVLFVIDTRTLLLEKALTGLGYNAVGVAADEARGRVFVSNMQGQVKVIDAHALQVAQTLEVGADQLLNLVYDPAGNRLLGVDQGIDRADWRNNHLEREYRPRGAGHSFFALDADSGRTLGDVPTGEVPIGIAFDAARQRACVASRGGVRVEEGRGALDVIDTAAYRPIERLALAPHPNSVALGERASVLYTTVKNDGAAKKRGEPESVVRIPLR